MARNFIICLIVFYCCVFSSSASAAPPAPEREFRAAWIATVYNLDWPSKQGLPAGQQKAELIRILDKAVDLNLNAVILQVRPASDALYASRYEPWSPYLTGTMGRNPGYDPLEFAVAEAHRRGLELHAWFNPFRAVTNYKNEVSQDHISKRQPNLVRRYGNYLWLDPGEPAVREHVEKVILDVVKRYDIDGVHIDDYFYPYKIEGKDFPDAGSWGRYGKSSGKSRGDWRRDNVNAFVRDLYGLIKREKPWVKFGISPFGIWRPGVPATIEAGIDAYGDLYADSRLWFRNGWLDYLAPQLYWNISPAKQSFPVLLEWWAAQNGKRRHLWAGIATDRIGKKRNAEEIASQIKITRDTQGADGHIHWSMKYLMQNQGGISKLLKSGLYGRPALVPASPWLDSSSPGRPQADTQSDGAKVSYSWRANDPNDGVWLWLVQTRTGREWKEEILPAETVTRTYAGGAPDEFAVSAVDRCGNVSNPMIIER